MTAQDDPYVRVYYRVLTDEKFKPLSSSAWGHWVRMLVVADGMFPSSAPLPRWVERKPLQELVAAGIVDLDGSDYFRIHGMEPERDRRADAARFAADVKHHGLPEAERRRVERANAVQPHAGAAPSAATQPAGRAIDASPLLSAPLRSDPIQSAPLRAEPATAEPTVLSKVTKKKSDDEELLDRYLNDWAKAPTDDKRSMYATQLRVMGVTDPAAELARRVAA
jgi:hypothetical protein